MEGDTEYFLQFPLASTRNNSLRRLYSHPQSQYHCISQSTPCHYIPKAHIYCQAEHQVFVVGVLPLLNWTVCFYWLNCLKQSESLFQFYISFRCLSIDVSLWQLVLQSQSHPSKEIFLLSCNLRFPHPTAFYIGFWWDCNKLCLNQDTFG